jgi:small subunit ribosomal protein S17
MSEETKEPEAEEPAAADAEAGGEEPVAEESTSVDEAGAEEPVAEEPVAKKPAKPAPKKAPAPKKPKAERKPKPKKALAADRERKPIVRLPRPDTERGKVKERRGVVVSSAMDKTVVVRVDTVRPHPAYKKIVRHSTKFHAHDERNTANVGDVVRIVETRPISKTKTWRLAEILEVAR